jgi:peptidylprolyl isomerase
MTQAKVGDTVRVHYTGRLENGEEFDSSRGRDMLEFTVGTGSVIRGFDEAVIGMEPGETKTIIIAPENAYGKHHDEIVHQVERAALPPGMEPEIGMQLQARHQSGQTFLLTITEVEGDTVTLDANHPLAGQELTFDIELVEIA